MNKYCRKCSKEIPKNSKKDLCENCQNKKSGAIRKTGESVLSIVALVGSLALAVITKGRLGGPKA